MLGRLVFMLLCTFFFTSSVSIAQEVSFTKEDRERLRNVEIKVERLEARVDEGLKAVNHRIDALDKRIDGLDKRIDGFQGLMYVVIGAVLAQTIGIVGFVLWDRRTALAPAINKNRELEEREEKIEKALKELAIKNTDVKEALKNAGIL